MYVCGDVRPGHDSTEEQAFRRPEHDHDRAADQARDVLPEDLPYAAHYEIRATESSLGQARAGCLLGDPAELILGAASTPWPARASTNGHHVAQNGFPLTLSPLQSSPSAARTRKSAGGFPPE